MPKLRCSFCLVSRPFSWPITITGLRIQEREPADDGRIVAKETIAVQLGKSGEDAADVVQACGRLGCRASCTRSQVGLVAGVVSDCGSAM